MIKNKEILETATKKNTTTCDASPDFVSENDALDYLAELYVNIYFDYVKKMKNG